jgi:putative aldouronate transport system substrate-binding protein
MRSTRRGAAAAVAILALTLTAACSSGGDSSDEPSASSSGIPDAQRVGAMDDFSLCARALNDDEMRKLAE